MLAELNYINGNSKFIAEEEEEEVEEEVNKVMLFLDCLFSRKKKKQIKNFYLQKENTYWQILKFLFKPAITNKTFTR